MTAINLAILDEAPLEALDGRIWDSNLSSVAEALPELVERLRAIALPPHWRPAAALDGFASWRVERVGEPAAWLDHSSVPRVRAAARLATARIQGRSACLPTIGVGAELLTRLDACGAQECTVVYEEDAALLAAALRRHALGDAIRDARFVPLLAPGAFEQLCDVLKRRPGLLPPACLINLPGTPPERLERAQRLCIDVAAWFTQRRDERLRALKRPDARRRSNRWIILASDGEAGTARRARELRDAAGSVDQLAGAVIADRPDRADPVWQSEQLAAADGGVYVAIGGGLAFLPARPPGTCVRWWTSLQEARRWTADAADVHCAASPAIGRELLARGAPRDRVLDFWWGVPIGGSGSPEFDRSGAVFLAGSGPASRELPGDLDQPTLRRIWASALELAGKQWEKCALGGAAALLASAERAAGVSIEKSELRETMLLRMSRGLIPSVASERILRQLEQLGVEPCLIGTGWRERREDATRCIARSVPDFDTSRARRVRAVVLVPGPDPLSEDLLRLAAWNVPLAIFAADAKGLRRDLVGVIDVERDAALLTGPASLKAFVELATAGRESAMRAAAARSQRVQREHSYAARIRTIAPMLLEIAERVG